MHLGVAGIIRNPSRIFRDSSKIQLEVPRCNLAIEAAATFTYELLLHRINNGTKIGRWRYFEGAAQLHGFN